MTSAQVVETSVTVTDNSPFQNYSHPDDHSVRSYYTIGFLYLWSAIPTNEARGGAFLNTVNTLFFSCNLAEESSDEENEDNEDDKEKQTPNSDKQRVDNLQTFRSLGSDMTDICSGVLLSESPAGTLLASAVKIEQLLKVCSKAFSLFTPNI